MEIQGFKFHGDWASGTLSRLPLSSMLELDPRVIDGSGDGQDPSDISWRYKVSIFMEIGHQEPCQDDPYPPCWSWILE